MNYGEVLEPKSFEEAPHRIVCAATKTEAGVVICSVRHFDVIAHALFGAVGELNEKNLGARHIQGFVDNKFQFLTRREAWLVAEKAGQIIRRCGGDRRTLDDNTEVGVLWSENLY